jgi:hypothetical protein
MASGAETQQSAWTGVVGAQRRHVRSGEVGVRRPHRVVLGEASLADTYL